MKQRVGVIHRFIHDKKGYIDKVEFFGYGEIIAEEVPPPGVMFMGIDMHKAGDEIAKIQLDNGDTVWGCECIFNTEETIQREIKDKEIIEVRINDVRGNSHYGSLIVG